MARPEITGKGSPKLQPRRLTAERYKVCKRTVERWEENRAETGFPPSILINGRRYDDLGLLNEWDRACAAQTRKARASVRAAKLAEAEQLPP
jgi:hypothetical protein